MIIRCEFLTSRYVAKETHTSVEWPPHPARLFYALVSALHAFDADAEGFENSEREALVWLESLDNPTIYCPQQDTISHRETVKHYVPVNDPPKKLQQGDRPKPDHLPELREKTARAFPTLSFAAGSNTVFFQWQNVDGGKYLDGLNSLFGRVSYLGHSSSLVALGFANAIPNETSLVIWHPNAEAGNGRVFRRISTGLLEMLEGFYEPNELSQQNYRLPSDLVRYSTAADEHPERFQSRSHFGSRWVVYRFPEWARVSLTASLALTTNLKTEACRLASEAGANISRVAKAMISGHKVQSGDPVEGPHVAWIALPYVGHRNASGLVFGVAAVLPQSLENPENRSLAAEIHRVLHGIHSLPFRGSTIGLERVIHKQSALPTFPQALTPKRWCTASKVWASVTPMALDRFPGFLFGRARRSEAEVESTEKAFEEAKASIRQSCANIGLPEPLEVAISKVSWVESCPPIHQFAPVKKVSNKPKPVHAHVRLTFEDPVAGPILLGRLRYLGMGLFVPIKSNLKGSAQ